MRKPLIWNKYRDILGSVVLMAALVFQGGCANVGDAVKKTYEVIMDPSIQVGKAEDQPSKVSLTMVADEDINFNQFVESETPEKGTPISFKVIQLKDDSLFLGADFDSLFLDLEKELGKTYVSHDDYVIEPGEYKYVNLFPVEKDVSFIAVFAMYSNFDKATWKVITEINPLSKEYPLYLKFTQNAVELRQEGVKE